MGSKFDALSAEDKRVVERHAYELMLRDGVGQTAESRDRVLESFSEPELIANLRKEQSKRVVRFGNSDLGIG
jgi:hypothetical protein